jgi:hypothetical protein
MENSAINQALVSRDSGYSFFDDLEINWSNFFSDFAKLVSAEYNSAGVDKRDVAVGGHNTDLWLFEMLKDPNPSWAAIVEWPARNFETTLSIKRPEKLLMLSLNPMCMWAGYHRVNPDAEAFFLNSYQLGLLERFWEQASGKPFSAPYASVNLSEILDGSLTGLDYIGCFVWDLDFDNTLLSALVSSLASGGVIAIGASNLSESLYRDGVLHNPFGDFHRFLKEQDGFSYHVASGHGITIFVKR